jgi:adenylate cyclase
VERAQGAIAKNPANGTALASGAGALFVLGESERASEWIHQALLLDPDNLNMRYNSACNLAMRLRDLDQAIETLRPWYQRVTSTTWVRHADADPDLNPIREDPRFKEMVAAAKNRLQMVAVE